MGLLMPPTAGGAQKGAKAELCYLYPSVRTGVRQLCFFVQQACAAELFSLAAMAAVDDVCGGLAWPR